MPPGHLRLAWVVDHIHAMTSATPKRIEILPERIGDVVARHVELGRVAGEFTRVTTGEIYFHYIGDGRRWYVNKGMSAFCQAAAIFNRFCEFHANDEDTDDPKAWATVAAQLRSELEDIEPLGDPTSSLWSATLEDSAGGLLSLW
jgi:hypothetical protein